MYDANSRRISVLGRDLSLQMSFGLFGDFESTALHALGGMINFPISLLCWVSKADMEMGVTKSRYGVLQPGAP